MKCRKCGNEAQVCTRQGMPGGYRELHYCLSCFIIRYLSVYGIQSLSKMSETAHTPKSEILPILKELMKQQQVVVDRHRYALTMGYEFKLLNCEATK